MHRIASCEDKQQHWKGWESQVKGTKVGLIYIIIIILISVTVKLCLGNQILRWLDSGRNRYLGAALPRALPQIICIFSISLSRFKLQGEPLELETLFMRWGEASHSACQFMPVTNIFHQCEGNLSQISVIFFFFKRKLSQQCVKYSALYQKKSCMLTETGGVIGFISHAMAQTIWFLQPAAFKEVQHAEMNGNPF